METIRKRLERIAREIITLSLVEGLEDDALKAITVSYIDREAAELEKEISHES